MNSSSKMFKTGMMFSAIAVIPFIYGPEWLTQTLYGQDGGSGGSGTVIVQPLQPDLLKEQQMFWLEAWGVAYDDDSSIITMEETPGSPGLWTVTAAFQDGQGNETIVGVGSYGEALAYEVHNDGGSQSDPISGITVDSSIFASVTAGVFTGSTGNSFPLVATAIDMIADNDALPVETVEVIVFMPVMLTTDIGEAVSFVQKVEAAMNAPLVIGPVVPADGFPVPLGSGGLLGQEGDTVPVCLIRDMDNPTAGMSCACICAYNKAQCLRICDQLMAGGMTGCAVGVVGAALCTGICAFSGPGFIPCMAFCLKGIGLAIAECVAGVWAAWRLCKTGCIVYYEYCSANCP